MKKLLVICILSGFVFLLKAQDTTAVDTTKFWKFGGVGTLSFSQLYFSNWSAGGEKAMSAIGIFNATANYTKDKLSWENALDLNLGFAQQGEGDLVKTDDRIEFASKLGYKASEKWYYTALLGFQTQFAEGSDPANRDSVISAFLAPAYLNFAIGMDYKPGEIFSLFMSPLNSKTTIVSHEEFDDRKAYGVEPGENILFQLGGLVKATFQKEILKNVVVKSRIQLFSNYLNKPGNIDVDWETKINMSINKYLTTNFLIHILYDDDNIKRTQIKELFGIGLTYKF